MVCVKMIVLTLTVLYIYEVFGQSPPPSSPLTTTSNAVQPTAGRPSQQTIDCQQMVDVSVLVNACQNFVSQRSSNPAIDAMAVDYAKQQPDIDKIVLYAEIDIVFVSCMQIIGDYEDLQELSGASSSATGPQSSAGGAGTLGATSTQLSSNPTPTSPIVTAPPPVSPTSTAQ